MAGRCTTVLVGFSGLLNLLLAGNHRIGRGRGVVGTWGLNGTAAHDPGRKNDEAKINRLDAVVDKKAL
jgi:hypothetical protein